MPVSASVRRHYDARAATHDRSEMHTGITVAIAEWIELKGNESVLDVATGTGLMLRSLADRWPLLTRVGVDLSPDMLAVARAEAPVATFVLADATSLPTADSTVDLLTCIIALHLMPEPSLVMDEWHRVLRPGGRVVTATFIPPAGHIEPSDGIVRNHGDYVSPTAFEAAGWSPSRSMTWVHEKETVLICELQRAGDA